MRSNTVLNDLLEFGFEQIVPNNSDNIYWSEMLFRPNSSLINIEEFFEKLNDSAKIDFDLLALDFICNLPSNKKDQRISLNVSPKSINSNLFLQKLNSLLSNKKIDPNNICLEIVESSKLEKISHYCKFTLENFRKLGGWVALDDFGKGYTHWELIEKELIDVIKVVNNNLRSENVSDTFYKGLTSFAKQHRITTVLEGIETEQDYANGIKFGFDYFQGYLFH